MSIEGRNAVPNGSAPAADAQGVHSLDVGSVAIRVISDGELPGGIVALDGVVPEEVEAAIAAAGGLKPISVNIFCIESGGRRALVDAGGGGLYEPLGKLWSRLEAIGLSVADFDTVLLSHMHPDHIGALVDAEGRAGFPNAELAMARSEFEFWSDEGNRSRVVDRVRPWFDLNARVVAAYRDRLRLFEQEEVIPGVAAEALPGHTPGHTGFRIRGDGKELLIWGDIMHRPDIQAPYPEGRIPFDIDPDQAARTRTSLLSRLAGSDVAVAGMHLHFPSVSRIERAARGFRVVPDPGFGR